MRRGLFGRGMLFSGRWRRLKDKQKKSYLITYMPLLLSSTPLWVERYSGLLKISRQSAEKIYRNTYLLATLLLERHYLQPKYEILTFQEKDQLLEKYIIQNNQGP
ncbi:hypothetical protein ACS0TY_014427 [Phlomoides rotata]